MVVHLRGSRVSLNQLRMSHIYISHENAYAYNHLITLDSRYIAVEYNTILPTIPEEESEIFVKTMNSRKTPHGSLFHESFREKSDRDISGAHCL